MWAYKRFFFVAYLLSSVVLAATPEQQQAIRDFEFQGMRFGTDVQVFRQRFRTATFEAEMSDPENGVHVFLVPGIQHMEGAKFTFIDKALVEISLIYSLAHAREMGGWVAVSNKITERFGKPDSMANDGNGDAQVVTLKWSFPEVQRAIEFKINTSGAGATFTNVEGWRKLEERKGKKAQVGF